MNRRFTWIVLLVVAVIAAGSLTASRRTAGPPLDPGSTAPDGARGVVELLERFGGGVDIVDGVPPPGSDTALLLDDRLSRTEAEGVDAWVRSGGVLVVADAGSLLTPRVAGTVLGTISSRCAVPGLGGVGVLEVGTSRTYTPGATDTGCFPSGGGSFLVAGRRGQGRIVSLGGPDLFTNDLLDEADNAVLAVALLAPTGSTAVAVVRPAAPGGGDRGLVDLVGTPVRAALAQLLVAFAVLVAWRARRLGRPIDVVEVVRIDGSELTGAVGRLLAQNRRPGRAAAILRDRARRELSAPLGLPLDASTDQVVSVVADRTRRPPDEVRRAIAGTVSDDHDLVEVATTLANIREEILHDRPVHTHN